MQLGSRRAAAAAKYLLINPCVGPNSLSLRALSSIERVRLARLAVRSLDFWYDLLLYIGSKIGRGGSYGSGTGVKLKDLGTLPLVISWRTLLIMPGHWGDAAMAAPVASGSKT